MMTTNEYLSLKPQERWAVIEEQVFGRDVRVGAVNYDKGHGDVGEDEIPIVCYDGEHFEEIRDRDEANGYMEIARRFGDSDFRRRPGRHDEVAYVEFVIFKDDTVVGHADFPPHQDYLAVQVASLRAVGFIKD